MKAALFSLALLALPASASQPTTALLKKGMKLPVTLNGQQKGWVKCPGGAQVQVLHVRNDKIMVGVGDSQAWVKRSDTDFQERLAASKGVEKKAQASVQLAQKAQNAAFQKEKAKATADFQKRHSEYENPLDKGAYNQTRSVVDYYDAYGRRYHIGVYGQRIYQ